MDPLVVGPQAVDVAAGVGNERVFTGQSFFASVIGFAVHHGLRAVVGSLGGVEQQHGPVGKYDLHRG